MTNYKQKHNFDALNIYCAFGLLPDGERDSIAINMCFEIVA